MNRASAFEWSMSGALVAEESMHFKVLPSYDLQGLLATASSCSVSTVTTHVIWGLAASWVSRLRLEMRAASRCV